MAARKFRGPKVDCDAVVLRAIEEHSYSDLVNEVGGMLVGEVGASSVTITGFVPALKAQGSQVSLTFSHDVWTDILNIVNKDFPGKNIVGWYHTHPGHGLFLSDYDKFIHTNFFPDSSHVAVVIDPIEGNRAWFATNAKGEAVEFRREPTALGPRSRPTPREVVGRGKRTPWIIAIAAAVVVAGGLGWGVAKATSPPNTAEALRAAREDLATIQAQMSAAQSSPVFEYTVAEGETLSSIALRFYGSEDSVVMLRGINDFAEDAEVEAGQVIYLAFVPGLQMTYGVGNSLWPTLDPNYVAPTAVTPTPASTPAPATTAPSTSAPSVSTPEPTTTVSPSARHATPADM
jgi:proteasome lid subunit RPN8/RPN11/cell division septation protein DedD